MRALLSAIAAAGLLGCAAPATYDAAVPVAFIEANYAAVDQLLASARPGSVGAAPVPS